MEWPAASAGFALGLLSSYLILRVQRRWQRKDDASYTARVVDNLILEIEEGLVRSEHMASLADQGKASFGRIFTALWDSTRHRLAATLTDVETLALLHRIYYRFDLINFNCDIGRPGSGGAFAKQYLSEIESNLSKLRARPRTR